MRGSRSSFLLMMAGLAVCALPVIATAEPQGKIVDLSKVGGPPSKEVLSYRGTGLCEGEHGPEDCLFVSPEGVAYSVFQGWVCIIDVDVAKVSKSINLPYGLKFGDSKSEAVAKLPKVKGVGGSWFVSEGRQGYTTGGGFYGAADSLAGLELWFDTAGRLVQAQARETCV